MKVGRCRVLAVVSSLVLTSIVAGQQALRPSIAMNISGAFGSLPVDALAGTESLSSPFEFTFTIVTDASHPIAFDTAIGTEVTMTITRGEAPRRFSGICRRVSERIVGGRVTYGLEVVPKVALLQLNEDSRIFQDKTVPEILQSILVSQGVATQFSLQRDYSKRNMVVQYRESDFNFISRLMEEEGIFYYFTHDAGGHTMVIADTSASDALVGGDVPFVAGAQKSGVTSWQKSQELVPGKVTLWDYNFELPDNHLDAMQSIQQSVVVGSVTHHLAPAATSGLEVYDYPGGYAKRFDGVPSLQNIFTDNKRVASTRMEEIAASAIKIDGTASVAEFSPGLRFNLAQHPNGNGQYLLTSVHHSADNRTSLLKRDYQNSFTAIPVTLPFRPRRVTPRPVIGTQTATVVGPAGEEIYTDKYGRIKVQFHWDRGGKSDADSSCWIRVGPLVVAPKIGDEVIVDFLEGDPDQPIVIGSLYNARKLPPPPP